MFFELRLTEDILRVAEDEIFAVHVSTNLLNAEQNAKLLLQQRLSCLNSLFCETLTLEIPEIVIKFVRLNGGSALR
jgi:hypothetical protein